MEKNLQHTTPDTAPACDNSSAGRVPYGPDISALNARRNARFDEPYDPSTGVGCTGRRVLFLSAAHDGATLYLPSTMLTDPAFERARTRDDIDALRLRHDFEYWAMRCVVVRGKDTGQDIPLVLNLPQRRVVAALERQRLAGRPLRIILLKARQWGGSTVIQMYMAWIQICHKRNWHSVICSHVRDTSTIIRGMYERLLYDYPTELWPYDDAPALKRCGGSANILVLPGPNAKVTLSSAVNQNAVRGGDYAMAHLSETAFWPATARHDPGDVVRAIVASVPNGPLTMVAMESTANGVGNYFHREWMRCVEGKGDKTPVFVPWYDIAMYREEVTDPRALWESLNDYEQTLWYRHECSLEQIAWYRSQACRYVAHDLMRAEFPTTPEEAFSLSGASVFATEHVEALRSRCAEPRHVGEVQYSSAPVDEDDYLRIPVEFRDDTQGLLKVWTMPRANGRYVATVDVGGRTDTADWSVIAVTHVDGEGGRPEVVAQWRGHIDHHLLMERAIALSRYYNDALLVVESNTLESQSAGAAHVYLLAGLRDRYHNLYLRRQDFDSLVDHYTYKVGFHTNRNTKGLIITRLIEAVRNGSYTERDNDACNEMLTYRMLPNGKYEARQGCHDDILMTRAITLQVINEMFR